MIARKLGVPDSWVRSVDHWALRGGSLVCSLVSAYAIHLFFAPLGDVDRGELVLTWFVAAAVGVLGYVVPRGMVHRMMMKESIWAYAPVCFLIELIDISCNYVVAASSISGVWVPSMLGFQQDLLIVLSYLIRSVIPLMSIVLAVVDMDLERKKSGNVQGVGKSGGALPGGSRPASGGSAVPPRSSAPNAGRSTAGNGASGVSAKEARQAVHFANQRKQQGQAGQQNTQPSVKNLLDDSEEELVAL